MFLTTRFVTSLRRKTVFAAYRGTLHNCFVKKKTCCNDLRDKTKRSSFTQTSFGVIKFIAVNQCKQGTKVITTVNKLLFSRTNESVPKNCRQDTC